MEEFFIKHKELFSGLEAIGSIMAAIATFCVVLVTVRLANIQNRIKLNSKLVYGAIPFKGALIGGLVHIINNGLREAKLSDLFFEWKVPFIISGKPLTLANSFNVEYQSNPGRRIKIEAGEGGEIVGWEISEFDSILEKDLAHIYSSLKYLKGWRTKNVSAIIHTQEGNVHKVVIAKPMRKHIKICL